MIDNDELFFILLKTPFDAVNNAVGFQTELALIGAAVLPWLIFAVNVRPCSSAPLALNTEDDASVTPIIHSN